MTPDGCHHPALFAHLTAHSQSFVPPKMHFTKVNLALLATQVKIQLSIPNPSAHPHENTGYLVLAEVQQCIIQAKARRARG